MRDGLEEGLRRLENTKSNRVTYDRNSQHMIDYCNALLAKDQLATQAFHLMQ